MSSRRAPSRRAPSTSPKKKSSGSPQKPVKGKVPSGTVAGKAGTKKVPSEPTPERRGAGAGFRLYAVIGGDLESLPEPQSAVPVLSWRPDATEAELRAFAAGWRAAAEQIGIPAWAEVRSSAVLPPAMRDTGMLPEDDDLDEDDWEDEEDEDLDEDEEDDLFGSDDD